MGETLQPGGAHRIEESQPGNFCFPNKQRGKALTQHPRAAMLEVSDFQHIEGFSTVELSQTGLGWIDHLLPYPPPSPRFT